MKKNIKSTLAIIIFSVISTVAAAQYKMDSNGKTISNRNNSTVLKISGNDIMNSSNSKVGTMSDVTGSISGAKPEAVYVALWWFIVKGNR